MIHQRVSLLTIAAYNLPKLRAFYQNLGWEETEISSDSYAVFKTAGVLLSLYPKENIEKDSGVALSKNPEYSKITIAINVDTPEQVDSTYETIKEIGGSLLKEPTNAEWGGRTAYFSDPEKNIWEIAWNPTSKFDERGAMISF
ncbi:VOC family protein [Falsibacillus pallidus]|uniref:VOC family protein n=1 Tax=Falsibacillus pallidus TaxID=493781 RepID=UPI003D95BC19